MAEKFGDIFGDMATEMQKEFVDAFVREGLVSVADVTFILGCDSHADDACAQLFPCKLRPLGTMLFHDFA